MRKIRSNVVEPLQNVPYQQLSIPKCLSGNLNHTSIESPRLRFLFTEHTFSLFDCILQFESILYLRDQG